MQLSTAVHAVARSLRKPGDLLPFFILGSAVPAIVRVAPFLGILAVWVFLWATGTFDTIQSELAGVDGSIPDPEQNPEAFSEWLNEVGVALEAALTPTVVVVSVGVFVLSVLVAILFSVLLSAVVSAGQFATCYARLRSERGLVAGIAGSRRFWLSFLGLYLLEIGLWIFLTLCVLIGAGLAWAVVVGAFDATLVGIPIAFGATFVWLLGAIAIRAVFAFAPAAVVVDDTTVFGSLANTVGFVRSSPVEAIFYYVIAVLALVGFMSLLSALSIVGVGSLVALVSLMLVYPVLALLKTALYGGYRDKIAPPSPIERSLRSQFVGGIRLGITELAAFVRQRPGTHGFVTAIGVATFAIGWVAVAPLEGIADAAISARIEGIVPPAAALEFFGNNWTVALTTAFSGVALAIPAITSIAFNGLFLGMMARLEVEPLELLAFVIPHGIFEIPAIIIAGAMGVHLGFVFWRTIAGSLSREEFADELERAFWVLVGVGVLLAIAGFVEGFISPFYYQPFL